MDTLTISEVRALLKVRSSRAALAQLNQWGVSHISHSDDGEQVWPAAIILAKMQARTGAPASSPAYPPGTYVYWRDDASSVHHGVVEETPSPVADHLDKSIRSVRDSNGALHHLRVERLVEML